MCPLTRRAWRWLSRLRWRNRFTGACGLSALTLRLAVGGLPTGSRLQLRLVLTRAILGRKDGVPYLAEEPFCVFLLLAGQRHIIKVDAIQPVQPLEVFIHSL